jgi:hypothetical protein
MQPSAVVSAHLHIEEPMRRTRIASRLWSVVCIAALASCAGEASTGLDPDGPKLAKVAKPGFDAT